MPLTNQVIIPKVDTRQNLEDQNVFKYTSFTNTPQKHQHQPTPILWKKSMSAFKKFKEKKDRKGRHSELIHQQPSDQIQDAPKIPLKLAKKTGPFRGFKRYGSDGVVLWLLQEVNLGYYDPNQAPLFQADGEEFVIGGILREKKFVLKQQTTVSYKPDQMIESVQSEGIEEENALSLGVQPLPGDPFIIIRKSSSKKSVKSSKTKFIKKQKCEKVHLKNCLDDESYSRDKRLSPSKGSWRMKGSEGERDLSEQKLEIGSKKIFTLQQIVQSASQKINQHSIKAIRFKDLSPEPDQKMSPQNSIDD